ncbi:MAG: flavocytochrome c [Angelakisella sp.]
MKRLWSVLLVIAFLFSVVGCAQSAPETTGLKDGIHTVETKGHNDTIVMEVTFDGGKIDAINIKSHQETPGVSDPAFSKVIPAIIEHQSLAVDAISGCTVTSKAFVTGVELAIVKAGGKVEDFQKPISKDTTVAEDVEQTADVVIVGAGGAGLAAAVSAVENNASVIVVEKMPAAGGNTIRSAGYYNAVDPKRQTPLGIEDSIDLHIKQTYEGGDKVGNLELITKFVNECYPTLEWIEGLGIQFKDSMTACVGAIHERTHTPVVPLGSSYIDIYLKHLESSDKASVIYDTKAEKLIVEDGKVVGVECTGPTGNKVTLRAKNGVILATGGFSANVEMRQEYNKLWPTLDENLPSTNHAGATGDGILMGKEVGANLIDMEYIQLFPLSNPDNGSTKGILNGDTSNLIYVNLSGERFTNEGGRRDDICQGILKQEKSCFYTICDGQVYPTGDEVNLDGTPINTMVKNGEIVKANSIEELAKALNMDPTVLKNSVDTYNTALASGKPDEFGRTLYNKPITTAPFYARIQAPAVHHTMGGLQINTEAQVIGTDGNVIPGLWAAGEVTGGIHGSNRLGGNAIPDTAVFGKIAGANAAGAKS